MTAKRFTMEREVQSRYSYSVKFGDKQYWFDIRSDVRKIVDLLNELHEENKELQKENKLLKDTLSSIVFDGKNVEIMTNGDVE